MTTTGGTGIPVPAGFDIKEIGGEVFEGGLIMDALLTMITAGMRFPRTFLEQGKTQEGDKAWLAWITTYAGYQKHLKRSIEHQLWRRHLQCRLGTITTRVKLQGKAIEEQDIVPIFVPKMSWKSEGKWHIQQKIEQLTKILNTANPVEIELKTEIEEDLARTLGYSELDLSATRKLITMQQKIKAVDAQVESLRTQMMLEALQSAQKKKVHLDMIPQLQGLTQKPEENPDRPKPVPLKRLAGGVSRMSKPTEGENQKGQARPQGGSRQPKLVQEIAESMIHFNSSEELFEAYLKAERQKSRNELFGKMIEALDNIGGE
jgi:hypothetical protein